MAHSVVPNKTPFGSLLSSNDDLPETADVVVIGGGIAGASAALELAKDGMRVVLIEKSLIASEQSGRNWGFVRQQGRDPDELPLAMMSNKIWSTLQQDLGADVGWKQGGNLALATDAKKVDAYRGWIEMAAGMGLTSKLLTMDQVRDLLPNVVGDWSVALYTESDAHADPAKATSAIARAAQKAGATLVTNCKVLEIESSGGAIRGVRTNRGSVRTPRVILAAGIWSGRLSATVGVRLPQGIVTNSVAATQPLPHLTDLGVWTRELAFRQLPDGRLILSAETATEVDIYLNNPRYAFMFAPVFLHNLGTFKVQAHRLKTIGRRAGMRHFELPTATPNLKQLEPVAERMRAAFPQLSNLRIESAWAGHIDGTADGMPIIGRIPDVEGLYASTGFTGHGFALGPGAGRTIAEIVLDKHTTINALAFRPSRFREGVRSAPKSLL
jgi:glycine/D-amino acid oxidase-like deaminating enzyme